MIGNAQSTLKNVTLYPSFSDKVYVTFSFKIIFAMGEKTYRLYTTVLLGRGILKFGPSKMEMNEKKCSVVCIAVNFHFKFCSSRSMKH